LQPTAIRVNKKKNAMLRFVFVMFPGIFIRIL
jgi:hypothetical protein